MGLFDKSIPNEEFGKLAKTVTKLESYIEELLEKEKSANEKINKMQNKIDELSVHNNILKSKIEHLENGNSGTSSAGCNSDIESRLSEIENQIGIMYKIENAERFAKYLADFRKALRISELIANVSDNREFISRLIQAQNGEARNYGFESTEMLSKASIDADMILNSETEKIKKVAELPHAEKEKYTCSEVADGMRIDKYNGFDEKNVVVPSEIKGIPVTEIGNEAFANCRSIRSLVLPNTLRRIGLSAFVGTSLEQLKIPEGTESIDRNALNVHTLIHICVPDSVTSIHDEVFFSSFYGRNIAFYCNAGSYAMEYAREHRIRTHPYEEYDMLL